MTRQLILDLFACALIGYLLGCLNPAVAVGRIKGYDPKRSGSGNPGASNTVIMAGKLAGLLVALLDILKAAAACRIAQALFPELRLFGFQRCLFVGQNADRDAVFIRCGLQGGLRVGKFGLCRD